MSQLNVLPINVSQSVDVIDDGAALASAKRNDDFSQLIEQHLTHGQERPEERKGVDSMAKAGRESGSEKLDQDPEQYVEAIDDTNANERQISDDISHAEQQELAASGNNGHVESVVSTANVSDEQALKASEQLMSFLYKADKTLRTEPELIAKQLEQLSPEQKALYEAQLLLKGSNLVADLSGLATALSTEQFDYELAQNTVDKKQLLSTSAPLPTVDKGIAKLPVEPIITDKLQSSVAREISEQMLLTGKDKVAHAELQTAQAGQKLAETSLSAAKYRQQNLDSASQDSLSKTHESVKAAITAEQVKQSELAISNISKSENVAINNGKPIEASQGKPVLDAAAQFESTQSELNKKIAELAQRKPIAQDESQGSTLKQASIATINQAENKGNSKVNSSVDINANSETNPELLAEHEHKKEDFRPVNPNQVIANQAAISSSEEQRSNQKSADYRINQANQSAQTSTSVSDAVGQALNKAQEQILTQEQLSVKGQSHLAQESEESVTAEKMTKPLKAEFSANASFTDVSSKATQVAHHVVEQQAADILNPAVSAEVPQQQKTNAQLHQETIAIFRKDFADAVKDKVMLMISQKLQRFDISLDPPELGNMQVRVNLQNEQAAVSFMVQNQQAKEAIEQNMHKLRDMLAQQGVDVGDANVEQQSQQSDNEGDAKNHNHQQGENIAQADDLIEQTLSARMVNASMNAVDYYA
ncbi:MAG: flagellar hook-length control protein FliK [Colwellia sp.]|nr:flagellar hook-length control protein FliK [Colwellia sp.]MCW8863831.1 flagellar hook-length control protein FliK [Colwellia sp.]MCW9081113.1 flagellar hook-length control protein FliK [Colwellia sp.]